jgi:hypothetical protein
MTGSAALKQCAELGLLVRVDGERLVCMPKGAAPQYLLDALRIHKAEIVKMLHADAFYPRISPSDRSAQLAFWRNMPAARPGHYVDDRGIEWPDHLGPGAVN